MSGADFSPDYNRKRIVGSSRVQSRRLARLEAQLRARIARRYRTVQETIRIGTLEIQFTRIGRPDDVLDQVIEEQALLEKLSGKRAPEDELHLPYWAEFWDSALGVGQLLCDLIRPDPARLRRPRSVLDLGCGMGLAGTVAAALGNLVLLADLESSSLLFAKLNTLPFMDRTRVRQLDWRYDRLEEKFDIVLGSDVLYERKQWEFLESFWRHHLAPGGAVILGEPGRQTGDSFPGWMLARGWRVNESEQRVATRDRPIRIFCVYRSQSAD